jgi:hypothetical protein
MQNKETVIISSKKSGTVKKRISKVEKEVKIARRRS